MGKTFESMAMDNNPPGRLADKPSVFNFPISDDDQAIDREERKGHDSQPETKMVGVQNYPYKSGETATNKFNTVDSELAKV